MPKILAVDDDLSILEIYKDIFAAAGFEVRTAEDAVAAVTLYQQFQPDLLVLDVDMPAGGGQKVFDRLRNLFQSPTPIIFSTGMPEHIQNLAKLANVAVIKKPFAADQLVAEAKRLLRIA